MKSRVLSLLDELAVPYRWVDHPAVFTVAESQAVLDEHLPVKNLLLCEQNGPRRILVVMAGERRLDLKALRGQLDSKKLQFAKPELLLASLGVTPGSVSLFSLLHEGAGEVELVVDERLVVHEGEVGFHPSDNTATIFFPAAKLRRVAEALRQRVRFISL
ncbi:prolyl-tRNA synthetase associated domain-containing protein [Candidatus Saccharibacteria bacterium]|nr:prolyl-tRNA synthetase associated domain-containing protein [Candidatus Saccharibacteria bacterium]